MTGEAFKLKGAACWASYLINGDASGLTPAEKVAADAWLTREGIKRRDVVDCAAEAHFSWAFDLWTGLPSHGGDVLEYTIIKRGET